MLSRHCRLPWDDVTVFALIKGSRVPPQKLWHSDMHRKEQAGKRHWAPVTTLVSCAQHSENRWLPPSQNVDHDCFGELLHLYSTGPLTVLESALDHKKEEWGYCLISAVLGHFAMEHSSTVLNLPYLHFTLDLSQFHMPQNLYPYRGRHWIEKEK